MAAQMHAGTVWVNCYNIFDAALPFGGYKQSGWGREMGHEVLNAYTQIKSVCIEPVLTPPGPTSALCSRPP